MRAKFVPTYFPSAIRDFRKRRDRQKIMDIARQIIKETVEREARKYDTVIGDIWGSILSPADPLDKMIWNEMREMKW